MNHDLEKDLKQILNETKELSKIIDKKCFTLEMDNQKYCDTIEKYKFMMENIILEHHNVCRILYEKN